MTKAEIKDQTSISEGNVEEELGTGVKRTRRQTKITESFALGRKSSQLNSKVLGQAVAQDIEEKGGGSINVTPKPRRTKTAPKLSQAIQEPVIKDTDGAKGGLVMAFENDLVGKNYEKDVAEDELQQISKENILESKGESDFVDAKGQPAKSLKSVEVIPNSSTPVQIPAYIRHGYLASSEPRLLPFPKSFAILERLLTALDGLCMLSAGRDQPVIIHKALKNLAASIGNRIELENIQILENIFVSDQHGPSRELYLKRPMKTVLEGRRIDSFIYELPEKASHEALLDRRIELSRRLEYTLRDKHGQFLAENGVKLPEGAKIIAWHPKFDLESIGEAIIDDFAGARSEIGHAGPALAAKDVPVVITEAIIAATPTKAGPKDSKTDQIKIAETRTPTDKKLSLLERIKQKEQVANLARMTSNPENEKRIKELQESLDFVPAISQLFSSANKSSLILEDAVSRLAEASKSFSSKVDVLRKIHCIASIMPNWNYIQDSMGIKVLKINRSISIAAVNDKISEEIIKIKSTQ